MQSEFREYTVTPLIMRRWHAALISNSQHTKITQISLNPVEISLNKKMEKQALSWSLQLLLST